MIFWIIVSLITLICLLAFFFASKNNVPAAHDNELEQEIKDEVNIPTNAYFKKQLLELDKDLQAGLISEQEAQAAKAELAREIIRLKADAKNSKANATPLLISTPLFIAGIILIGVLSFTVYITIGSPNLPSSPLALRITPQEQQVELQQAIEKVEERLKAEPDDARGWAVLGPIYMKMGRFDEAVKAFRNVLRLLPPSADAKTDLAEALLMANDSESNAEIMDLLKSASKLDPNHVRSRFYLASEAMRRGENASAIEQWQELLAIANGEEEWVEVVKEGLAEAQARLNQPPIDGEQSETVANQPQEGSQAEFIKQMVEQLETRLVEEGGSIEEWTQLVRSFLVLGEKDKAKIYYEQAIKAHPNAQDRVELDNLASDAGLKDK